MQLRYRFRLYPTPGHRVALARAFGCARVVFNEITKSAVLDAEFQSKGLFLRRIGIVEEGSGVVVE